MNKYNEAYFKLFATNVVEDNDKIWMALANKNGICEIDKKTRHTRIIKTFKNEPLMKKFLYCNSIKINNNLIFSPGTAKEIAIYDLEHDFITYIPLKKLQYKCKENQNEIKFWNIVPNQSSVYLCGYSYPAIVKIDMRSLETKYITDWVLDIDRHIEDGDSCGYFTDGYVISGDHVLLPVGCMNAILELNLKTEQTKLKKLEIPMKGIGGISSIDEENIWLVGKGSRTNWIVCWNRYTDIIKKVQLLDLDENIFDPFFAPLCTNSKVFFMPMSAHCIYEMDIEFKEIKKNKTLEPLFENKIGYIWSEWKTMAPRLHNNCLIFFTNNNLEWHEYNTVTEEVRNYCILLDIRDLETYFDVVFFEQRKANIVVLEKTIPLKFFMDKILKIKVNNRYSECEQTGKKINDFINTL